jgi:hypothetical protein
VLTAPKHPSNQTLTLSSAEAPGTRRSTGRGHVISYGDGRLCAIRDCATQLSRYNSTSLCWAHERAAGVSLRN